MAFVTLVPEGHATVAQRFNPGCRCRARRVPKGRMKNNPLNRPFGTQTCRTAVPALKRWAILVHPSGMEAPILREASTHLN